MALKQTTRQFDLNHRAVRSARRARRRGRAPAHPNLEWLEWSDADGDFGDIERSRIRCWSESSYSVSFTETLDGELDALGRRWLNLLVSGSIGVPLDGLFGRLDSAGV